MDLRYTDTNSADDSRGRAFGLEGDLYLPVVIAVVVSLGLLALLGLGFKTGWLIATSVSVWPAALTLVWATLLRHGRPPGYDRDWIEQRLGGGDFSRQAAAQRRLLD
jgi:hypothetical protein